MTFRRITSLAVCAAWALAGGHAPASIVTFAVIGDYGSGTTPEADVAALVASWNPDLVITVGDNNYESGLASTIDQNIGQFYHRFIHPYTGAYGPGAAVNRFFPALGNHDWGFYPNPTGDQPYLDYFTLPGNERYYDFVWGPVHFFALDSDPNELDGAVYPSTQAAWLEQRMTAATEPWKIVYFHHAPYASDLLHASQVRMQWPFAAWGASSVMAGHSHVYERLEEDGIPYFVNGIGGHTIYDFLPDPVPGSLVRYNLDFGAMKVTANDTHITYEFISRDGVLRDALSVSLPYTWSEAVRAVRAAGGLLTLSEAEASRLSSASGSTPHPVTLEDAVCVARKAAGLGAEP